MKPSKNVIPQPNEANLRSALFGTPWAQAQIALSNGDQVALNHPDFAFLPPDKGFLLVVEPDYKMIYIDQIVSVTLQTSRAKAATAKP